MGSVIGMANASGASTANIKYDSFGNIRSQSGASAAISSSIGAEPRYHGMLLDQATGLYHVRARTYDARTGRFTSKDPVDGITMEPERNNPYAYGNSNPHIYVDPSGLFVSPRELPALLVVAAVIVMTAVAIAGAVMLNTFANSEPEDDTDEEAPAEPSPWRYIPAYGPLEDTGTESDDPSANDIWLAYLVPGFDGLLLRGPVDDSVAMAHLANAYDKQHVKTKFASSNVWAATGRRVAQVAPWPLIPPEIDKAKTSTGTYANGEVRYCHYHDALGTDGRTKNAHLFFGPAQRGPVTCSAY